ncbi:hypothetical protein QE390_005106 [Siphonobacter sp. SORGH_AS 1065]|nr:hypothetical protein [Siphonobacter sp. SORGH_AS_1065]
MTLGSTSGFGYILKNRGEEIRQFTDIELSRKNDVSQLQATIDCCKLQEAT